MDLNREIFICKFNWAGLSAFAAFWTYGLFGALTIGSFGLTANILISLILAGIFFWLFRLSRDIFFEERFVFRIRDLIVILATFSFLLIFSFNFLSNSLVGDQLAHAQQSQLPAISLIDFFTARTDFFDYFSFKNAIWLFDILILIAAAAALFFFRKKKWQWPAFFFGLVFLAGRLGIVFLGGSGGPHPPFRLFPLWLTGSIFSPDDFSFRLAQFFGLVAFIWILQRISEERLGFWNSWLVSLAAGTMPVVWHVGLLAEQSIWTAVLWSVFLISLFFFPENFQDKEKYFLRWFCLISIFALMRQPVFLTLAPLILIFWNFWRISRPWPWRRFLFFLSPLLALAPFLLKSLFFGTPADYAGTIPVWERLWTAFHSGIIFNSIFNSLGWIWLFFLAAGIFLIFRKFSKFWPLLVFFLGAWLMFYAINPDLWGFGRYQAEYAAPFAIFGLFGIFFWLKSENARFLSLAAAILVISNIFFFSGLASANAPVNELRVSLSGRMKELGHYSVLSELPYDYRSAFRAAKDSGYAGKLFVAGATYGVFGEIMNGFAIAEARAGAAIYRSVPPLFNAADINRNNAIELVLISDFFEGDSLRGDLADLGWRPWRNFRNNSFGSTIFGLIRPEQKK